MVKFWFTDNPDLYKFNNKNKLEVILFKFGFIFSSTTFSTQEIDVYSREKDEVIKGQGLRRISHSYAIINKKQKGF